MRTIVQSFCLIFVSIIFFSCDSKTSGGTNASMFKNYIQSYGPTSMSKQGEFFIDLQAGVNASIDEESLGKYIKVSPSIEADFFIKDNDMIIIHPTSELKSNTDYQVSVDLSKILNDNAVPKDKFSFEASVVPQHASLTFQDYFYYNDGWYLDVVVNLNDEESLDRLRELTTVKVDGKENDFSFKMENSLKPILRISNLKPSTEDQSLEVEFLSSKLGADKNVDYSFTIPQTKDLSLLKTTEQLDSKAVHFIFNKTLATNQNLDGFLSITNSEKSPKYKIKANTLTVFFDRSTREQRITVKKGVKASDGDKMDVAISHIVGETQIKPQVWNVGLGHIIPTSNEIVFPFEAQGLDRVRLEIFKIHTKNLQQFYQRNTLRNAYQLEYVGEVVYSEQINLAESSSDFDPFSRKRYHFNLKNFMNEDPSSIYELRIGFLPQDVSSDCAKSIEEPDDLDIFDSGYYGVYGYYNDYDWDDRDNPCKKGYYNVDRYASKIIVNTNIGILAKKGNNGNLTIYANDINTTTALTGAGVYVYNKAQRELINTKTDAVGRVSLENMEDAYLIKVVSGTNENWLRIQENESLSLSKFKVAGRVMKNGLDGFIYTERNVWRPGDTMYVDFILKDHMDKIPDNHPVKLSLKNPQGKEVFSEVKTNNYGPMYSMMIPTKTAFATGDYTIYAKVGANEFSKPVKIETIKPNKFAIKNNADDIANFSEKLRNGNLDIRCDVDWLYGAPAKNKDVKVELGFRERRFSADGFTDYNFDDPRNNFYAPPNEILSEKATNAEGEVDVRLKLGEDLQAPGYLNLLLKTTAYESSGDFSTDVSVVDYYPYSHYVGVEIPRNEYNYKRTDRGKDTQISFVSLSDDKKPASARDLKVTVYKMENYWWYNSYNDEFSMNSGQVHVSDDKFEITSARDGKASINVTFNTYGRYYIQACDQASGHCTGDYIYVGYPWNDGEMTMAVYEEAAQLNFDSEKDTYASGETVVLNVPSYFMGKALVSLENGDQVVESFWTEVQRGNNKIKFTAQPTMFPTIYAHVTLLQAHMDKSTDMPIRSYGVIPIKVEDDRLELKPKIGMPDELKPKELFQVTVKEEKGKPMYYTLAVVDEGLLNITKFPTPDPMKHFYAKPALGVRTFDMYNEVMSNYGRDIDQLFSIGGDGVLPVIENVEKANRFKSVVKHIGPFYLGAKAQNKHEIQLPNYIGNVRVMVVAAEGERYGNLEKNVPVKQDLMVLTTLPRTLAPGDQVSVPLTIFTMKDGLGAVNYSLNAEGVNVQLPDNSGQFNSQSNDEKLIALRANVGDQEGVLKFNSRAQSSSLQSTQNIEVQVENPNPIIRRSSIEYLKANESKSFTLEALGKHDSEYSLSVSSFAPVNLEEIIDNLTRYPYGCLEQRTSAAFAYLYQKDLLPEQADDAYGKQVVNDHLNVLYRFKQSSGYSLWPGNRSYDGWVTNFVGDFLVAAKEQGFGVSKSVMNSWINDQKAIAANWSPSNKNYRSSSIFSQAYRLYTLAKANEPAISEMNRLREDFKLDYNAGLLLAAAYAEAGRDDVASKIFDGLDKNSPGAENYRYTYGSNLRNSALRILLLNQLNKDDQLAQEMKYLNDQLQKNPYMSTQTGVFVVRAIASIKKKSNYQKDISIQLTDNGNSNNLTSSEGSIVVEGPLNGSKSITIENKNPGAVFIQLTRRAKEDIGSESVSSQNLEIKTVFLGEDGKVVDVKNLEQGTDFTMVTTVSKKATTGVDFDNLALRQAVPSGWEIVNDRLTDFGGGYDSGIEYQDIRDSKVHSFFDLSDKRSVKVKIKLKATYAGEYYMPKTLAESMYSDEIYAEEAGYKVKVAGAE